jgi:hypothetical protein
MRGADNVRLELDNRERRAVSKSLINRKKLLIEIIHDTTPTLRDGTSQSFSLRRVEDIRSAR